MGVAVDGVVAEERIDVVISPPVAAVVYPVDSEHRAAESVASSAGLHHRLPPRLDAGHGRRVVVRPYCCCSRSPHHHDDDVLQRRRIPRQGRDALQHGLGVGGRRHLDDPRGRPPELRGTGQFPRARLHDELVEQSSVARLPPDGPLLRGADVRDQSAYEFEIEVGYGFRPEKVVVQYAEQRGMQVGESRQEDAGAEVGAEGRIVDGGGGGRVAGGGGGGAAAEQLHHHVARRASNGGRLRSCPPLRVVRLGIDR